MAEVPTASPAPKIRNSRKPPADFTGKQQEKLNAANEVEKAEAASAMAMATAEKVRADQAVVDYTGADTPLDEVEVVSEVEINEPEVVIRVNSDIDQMTFGKEVVSEAFVDDGGNYHQPVTGSLRMYNFEAGRRYRVPRDLALHLIRLGYVYDY